MMSLATLPVSFWDYALESTALILNMVPTKKVDKTPYELWHGKVPNLSYLKVWGCEAHVKRLTDEDILPSENTSEHPIEEESLAPIFSQEEDVILVLEEHSLGDLNEPANYKEALLDPEFKKWLVVMNAKMQSMYDNKVWRLVVLPPNAKVVKSKWIYKKKTDMDGKETFSPAADIRAIRILIAIAVYYDYEICLQEVKTYLGKCFSMKVLGEAAFILGIKIYRDRSRQLIGLSQNAYLDKILKRYRMDNSKRGSIPMQVDLHLSKSQRATTSAEMKRMQNVPYASAVGSIMYAVRNTKDTFLVYGDDPEAELRVNCYCNAGFETDRDDTKSQTGCVFVLNGGVVVWKSSKQNTTAQHATKAEYIAAFEAAKEAVWIRKFIDELGVVLSNDYPIKMNCEIDIVKVHTDDNLADPFTKALAGPKLTRHARSMGLHPASSFIDSPFQLEAYSDSDYAGSHGDRKSTTSGCQFMGRRLISWQCKKQTIVATSFTEAEYVAAASCCGQISLSGSPHWDAQSLGTRIEGRKKLKGQQTTKQQQPKTSRNEETSRNTKDNRIMEQQHLVFAAI
nr:hypothetical protein [Tanacetum cinerariifolium]